MSLTNHGCIQIKSTEQGTPTEFNPKSVNVTIESLADSDSGRTADGTMHINWILKRIRKLEIEMPVCSPSVASSILNLVQGREYWITFWDPLTNTEMTKKVYTSNSKANCYNGVLLTNGLWQGVQFSAIELAGESN